MQLEPAGAVRSPRFCAVSLNTFYSSKKIIVHNSSLQSKDCISIVLGLHMVNIRTSNKGRNGHYTTKLGSIEQLNRAGCNPTRIALVQLRGVIERVPAQNNLKKSSERALGHNYFV